MTDIGAILKTFIYLISAPLLHSGDDLILAREAVASFIPAERNPDEAVVLAGHGTCHKGRQRYLDFQEVLRERDPMILVGALMGKPGCADILDALRDGCAPRLAGAVHERGRALRAGRYPRRPSRFLETTDDRRRSGGGDAAGRDVGTSGSLDIWLEHLRAACAAFSVANRIVSSRVEDGIRPFSLVKRGNAFYTEIFPEILNIPTLCLRKMGDNRSDGRKRYQNLPSRVLRDSVFMPILP